MGTWVRSPDTSIAYVSTGARISRIAYGSTRHRVAQAMSVLDITSRIQPHTRRMPVPDIL
eukprot:1452448-Rhodomonas_salina.1